MLHHKADFNIIAHIHDAWHYHVQYFSWDYCIGQANSGQIQAFKYWRTFDLSSPKHTMQTAASNPTIV